MSSHEEGQEITSLHEAPPWTLTRRVRELRPYTRNHHELSVGGSWNYVLPIPYPCFTNNHKVLMHTNFMLIYISNHPNISYQTHQFQPIQSDISCIFTCFIPNIGYSNQSYNQQSKHEKAHKFSVPVSLKLGTLAQAKEVFCSSCRSSLRRDCQQKIQQGLRVLAWARPLCVSETTPRPKVRSLAWVTTTAKHLRLSRVLA